MKTRSLFGLAVVVGLAVILGGCASGKPDPDPLAGWKGGTSAREGNPYAREIADDYVEYVRKLPTRERTLLQDYDIRFYEDGTGRHAVKIHLPHDGTIWDHILIYGPDNRRIQTIKRFGGHYRS